ncbi:MAG: response regulator [Lysobacter sp.]|nr:response regulator [Lysobacter sp.]
MDGLQIARPTSLCILIVEDELDNALALQFLLQTHGHAVDIATDAEMALCKCRSVRYDVLLCDIELPGQLDGYDVARTLRKQSHRPYLIAYSGYSRPQHLADSHEAGFDEHIVKPAGLSQILAALQRCR